MSAAAGCRAIRSSSCFRLCHELGLRREGARLPALPQGIARPGHLEREGS